MGKIDKKSFIIHEREVVKIMTDPLRNQILEIMLTTPHTVKQVADKLGLAASKLYYHFSLLEKHGLIQMVETRMVSNMVEKWYQATASSFEIAPELLSVRTDEGKGVVNEMIQSTIDTTRDDLLRSLQARYFQLEHGANEHPRRIILNRTLSRIPENRVEEFHARMDELLADFEAANQDSEPDSLPYALTIAFYPSFYFDTEKGETTHG